MSPPDGNDWPIPRSVTTMPESLDVLQAIIDWGQRSQSPLGYFAALYAKVGHRLEEAIGAGRFRDEQRMRNLDVVFFNRYLEALHQWRSGPSPTLPWRIALDAVGEPRAIVVQHLLLAMNAHINLDLGVATADAVPAADLDAFEGDFDTMNGVLASLMDDVQRDLGAIFPLLKPINFVLGKEDDRVLNFSMKAAREISWKNCRRISGLAGAERDAAIAEIAIVTGQLARGIVTPGILGGVVTRFIRMRETGDVATRIAALQR